MSNLFGHLGLADTDRVFNATAGQRAIYEVAAAHVAERNAALNAAMAVFIEETTSEHQRRYKLPGGGRLQRRGASSQTGAVKASGQWDVAFPLEDFGAQVAGDDVAMAYMTAAELSRHIDTVTAQNINTVRFEILKAMLNNTARTFTDELWGSLTIQPLANDDTVVYPPVEGSETEATEDHYLTLGNATISDSNDPFPLIIADLDHHFGRNAGNSNVVTFINTTNLAATRGLAGFVEVPDQFITPGDDTAVPTGLPNVPGRIVGRHAEGSWIVQWDWIPANYMLGVYMGAPAPLVKRTDPADTGLPTDLALVSTDQSYPMEGSHWRHRFGVGAGNRLNGVAIEITADASYDIPAAYA